MPYNSLTSRADAAGEVPQQVVEEIIGSVRTDSTLMALGHEVPTTTRDSVIPVLTQTPDAYWIDGDAGLKQTSKAVFTNTAITAAECAVIVPIPDSVIEDSEFALWETVKPLVSRAFARKIDKAALFGIDKPLGWGASLYEQAVAAGNTVTSTADPVADLLGAAEQVADEEYHPSGAVVRVGWEYGAARSRSDAFTGSPVGEGQPFAMQVAGLPIFTGPCFFDRTAAEAIVADWSCAIYGIRRDLRFEIFNTGVLTDEQGNITLNLLSQDVSALRCTMRIGFLLARPATQSGTVGTPVSIVTPGSSAS